METEKRNSMAVEASTVEGRTSEKNEQELLQQALIQAEMNKKKDKKKLTIEGERYYVVTIDEVDYYKEHMKDYTAKEKKPFIIYMNSEFKEELTTLRRAKKIKIGTIIGAGCLVLLILILVLAYIFQ